MNTCFGERVNVDKSDCQIVHLKRIRGGNLSCRICLEVEFPDNEISRRRIGFYERNGFVLNNYPYIQPPISEGRNPVPLKIMTTDKGITEEQFNKIRALLYKYVYNVS